MGQDVLNTQPSPGTDADLVIREARRRQRRRRLVTGLVLAVVLAGTIGVAAGLTSRGRPPVSHPRPRSSAPATRQQVLPSPIPHSVGTTVLLWPVVAHGEYPTFGPHQWPPAYVDDLATGRLSRRHKLAFAGGDFRPYLVSVGHWLVYVGGGGAMVIRDNLKGRPRMLGRTPFFAPAASPGHIWLERIHGYLGPGERASVWQVSVRTGRRGPVTDLPRNSQLVAGTGAGLLLDVLRGHDFSLALWRPGVAPRLLPYSPRSGSGLDASSRLVTYGTGCRYHDTVSNDSYSACQVLRIYNVVTGRLLSFRAPPGTVGWLPLDIGVTQAIAPGGRLIAAYAATLSPGRGRGRLFVLRLGRTGGPPRAVPSSAGDATLSPRTAWSADGSWLFFQGPGRHLWAYQVSSGRVLASGTPCCGYTVMAAYPSPRH
jgi:hypothetical protein